MILYAKILHIWILAVSFIGNIMCVRCTSLKLGNSKQFYLEDKC